VGAELISRIIGGVALSILGWYAGQSLSVSLAGAQAIITPIAMTIVGLGLGSVITPHLTVRPFLWFRNQVRRVPTQDVVAATLGLLIGLIVSALLAIPLSMLPSYFGNLMPFIACVAFSYLGIWTMVQRKNDLINFFRVTLLREREEKRGPAAGPPVLLDTSAIIDGRIADISQTGFVSGTLVIPRFVLDELQRIADSADALRRNRGRRGLDMLSKLQKESVVPIEVRDVEVNGGGEVDGKLIKLAKQLGAPIITNDFNLNRVAALQGIKVLNINELANAVKSVVLPGEEMIVRIIQEGKELGQGVGYLDDGTMVVVENGRRYLGSEIEIVVTRVLQTAAGRMIFSHPKSE